MQRLLITDRHGQDHTHTQTLNCQREVSLRPAVSLLKKRNLPGEPLDRSGDAFVFSPRARSTGRQGRAERTSINHGVSAVKASRVYTRAAFVRVRVRVRVGSETLDHDSSRAGARQLRGNRLGKWRNRRRAARPSNPDRRTFRRFSVPKHQGQKR